jgi:hypothetical protein
MGHSGSFETRKLPKEATILNKSLNNAGKTAGVVIFGVAGIVITMWVGLIISDLLAFYLTYAFVYRMLDNYSINEWICRGAGVCFGLGVGYYLHNFLYRVVKRDKKWMAIVAALLLAGFAMMYIVSWPYSGGIFDPFSGKAQAVYLRMPDGTIKRFPKGMKYDPDTGRPLQEFDPATAEEYQRQQGVQKKMSAVWKTPADANNITSKDSDDNLVLWVEKIQRSDDLTIVYLACEGKNGEAGKLKPVSTVSFFWNDQNWTSAVAETYLVDNWGRSYDPEPGAATFYESLETTGALSWTNPHIFHTIRVDEICRFALAFPGLGPDTSQLRLHLANFEPGLDLNNALDRAERIPNRTPAQPAASPSPVTVTPAAPAGAPR